MPANWTIKVSRVTYAAYPWNCYITFFTTVWGLNISASWIFPTTWSHTTFEETEKMSYEMLAPILNLVNRYDQCLAPRMSKKALQHEAKINTSPKSPKLDLCLRPALSQKPPLISHQRKTLCLCPHSQISRRLLLIWSIWHCVIIHKINHPNGDFPEFSEPNPILSDHSFWNSLPDCLS